MISRRGIALLALAICLQACGNGSSEADPDDWKAEYAEKHITFLNTMDINKVESSVGPLYECVTRFKVTNSGDREFSGSFRGFFVPSGNKGRIPYLKDFTVGPKAETSVETMFRHTTDEVSSSCTAMTPK